MLLAAMARPSRRFGGPRARCADKQGFPSWMRPGDRPPVQRSNNRPLMWNCCRQLKDRPGQLGGPSMFFRLCRLQHDCWRQSCPDVPHTLELGHAVWSEGRAAPGRTTGERSLARRRVPGAAGRRLHRQRRRAGEKFRARRRGRRPAACQRRRAARQVRRRFRRPLRHLRGTGTMRYAW
jgi:hypothetical protein